MTSTRRPRVVLFAAPETSASVMYGLYDVLLSVATAWPDMTTAPPASALLDVQVAGRAA